MENEYTKEKQGEKLKKLIIKEFGENHNIRLAILHVNSKYNDEGYDYNPTLILINNEFNEVDHRFSLYHFKPDEDEVWDYWEEHNEDLEAEDVTVKF